MKRGKDSKISPNKHWITTTGYYKIILNSYLSMSLIKSISGIRGTIGGQPGEGLSPLDIVKFTAAYATFPVSYTHLTLPTIYSV